MRPSGEMSPFSRVGMRASQNWYESIVFVETDERLAPKEIECDLVLRERVERAERRRIDWKSDSKLVLREVSAASSPPRIPKPSAQRRHEGS